MSAIAWATACWADSGPPYASRLPTCATVASSAACAMPTANAPTLGRNRSSVRMATRNPESTSPRTSARSTRTPSKVRLPIGCGEIMSRCSPDSPGEPPATANAVTPRAPVPEVRANTV
jgi:hypothetical protein